MGIDSINFCFTFIISYLMTEIKELRSAINILSESKDNDFFKNLSVGFSNHLLKFKNSSELCSIERVDSADPHEYGVNFLNDLIIDKFAFSNYLKLVDKFKEYESVIEIINKIINVDETSIREGCENCEKEELVLVINILYLSLHYVGKLYNDSLNDVSGSVCTRLPCLNGELISFYIYKEIYDIIYDILNGIVYDVIHKRTNDYYDNSDFYDYLVLTYLILKVMNINDLNYLSLSYDVNCEVVDVNYEKKISNNLHLMDDILQITITHTDDMSIFKESLRYNTADYIRWDVKKYGYANPKLTISGEDPYKCRHLFYKLLDNYCCKK